jgi:gluconate kinase
MPRAPVGDLVAHCPACQGPTRCTLYSDRITQRKRISIRPISPACLRCGGAVVIHTAPGRGRGRTILALTGTCGSGKSTTAEVLTATYGFSAIDGNCVQDVIRSRLGTPAVFNGPEMLDEFAREIDILLSLDQDVVISHVILPDDLPTYRNLFRAREVQYRFVVLKPTYSTALERCRNRTSFNTMVADVWVRQFHSAIAGFERSDDVVVLDNTDGSAEDSARRIITQL